MILRSTVCVLFVLLGPLSVISAQTAGGSSGVPPAPESRWRPSVFLMASADENTDPPLGAAPVTFEQPAFAGNLAAGLDGSHRTARMRTAVGLFGLIRSPLSGPDRALYLGGQVSWSWQLHPAWRIGVTDSGKIQRQPQFDALGFQRNNAALDVEWRRPASPVALSFEIADRRRTLPSLEILGFDRQAAGMGIATSSGAFAGEVRLSVQQYHAPTATGRRMVASAEAARFGRATIVSARYALIDPRHDRPRPFAGEAGELGEFSDIDRADFLEQLAFAGSDVAIANELFVVDPIETDSDDWDFGRRKHVAVGYLSRRFSDAAVLSGSIRYQRRDGPNLLAPEGSDLAAPFRDHRLALRASYRRPLSTRFTLVAQASLLRNRGDRPIINFSRRLFGVGLQIHF